MLSSRMLLPRLGFFSIKISGILRKSVKPKAVIHVVIIIIISGFHFSVSAGTSSIEVTAGTNVFLRSQTKVI